MASSSNGNGNLVDEFEEAFQACLHALTKQESNTGISKEEIELEVQQTASKFIDVARQMEAFFLQKRFLISSLQPETLLKDENQELRYEILRKDALINKHYSRLEEWKMLLSDQQQQQGYNKLIPQSDIRSLNNPGTQVAGSSGMPSNVPVSSAVGGGATGISSAIQAQLQQQHMQAQQQQQQQMMQAQQMHQQMQQMQVGSVATVAAQQMYMQQGAGSSVSSSSNIASAGRPPPPPPPFNQNPNLLQGPLAYLEKTTSNIDLVGMGDGRR